MNKEILDQTPSHPRWRGIDIAPLQAHLQKQILVWEYRHEPPLYGFALGFAQRIANGNTLICYGTAQRIIEVDRTGTKQWELVIHGQQIYAYRAFRIDSLY